MIEIKDKKEYVSCVGKYVALIYEDFDQRTGYKKGITKYGEIIDVDLFFVYLKTSKEGTLIFPLQKIVKIRLDDIDGVVIP